MTATTILWSMTAFASLPHSSIGVQEQWEFVCGVRHVDCTGIPLPIVVPADLQPFGYYGYFRPDWDARFVYVDASLDSITADIVTTHEMSHYLDYNIGLLPFNGYAYDLTQICRSEEVAFNIANDRVAYEGYDQAYARYDWIEAYPHCQL